ncbi:MAG: acyl-CoA dehydratase activase [Planctomycetes bacterium]|jgi:predicted CoA-substrate-specific enzyme activase|nr:acyl-CoA dehydratase activase [Planctomycetota bacterium]
MISVGIDIGSTTTKAVLLREGAGTAHVLTRTGNLPGQTAREVYGRLLSENSLVESDVDVVATTGYGRRLADFGDVVMTEIKACVAGVRNSGLPPAVRNVIDVGGQDTKVIAFEEDGEIRDFSMNDKCAAGTGRFLEMLAGKLELPYEEFVRVAAEADQEIQMNSTCAVFAESEVVGLLARNVSKANLSAAAHDSIAFRVASMVRRVRHEGEICFVGGGAANTALVRAVEEHLGEKVRVPPRFQMVVALGAAVEGLRTLAKHRGKEGC